MNRILIEIDTDGAAFDSSPEIKVAKMLNEIATQIRTGGYAGRTGHHSLRDLNGNRCGYYDID